MKTIYYLEEDAVPEKHMLPIFMKCFPEGKEGECEYFPFELLISKAGYVDTYCKGEGETAMWLDILMGKIELGIEDGKPYMLVKLYVPEQDYYKMLDLIEPHLKETKINGKIIYDITDFIT